jgi:protein-arginine kinase activator protein McsA
MLCCICKAREATVHLTQTVTATTRTNEIHLCEACADKKGVNDPTCYPLAELLHQFATETSHQTPEE